MENSHDTQARAALVARPHCANPRRNADSSPVEGLAESIRTDGVLQNLVVEPAGDGQYHVVAGTRRLRALMHLQDRGDIDDGYKVPVEIRKDLDESRLVRLATVENVQREPLDPIDEAETTYFDDTEQFLALQKQAVEELAAEHGKIAEWVEVLSCWHAPWWQYRKATDGEADGTVINLSPSGAVEVRTGLAKHPVREEVAEETRAPQEAAKRERRPYDKPTLRYIAAHKSVAVQAALLASPRKAKEVAAVLLLSRGELGSPVRIDPHPSVAYFAEADEKPKGCLAVDREIERLAAELGQSPEQLAAMSRDVRTASETPLGLYEAVQKLGDEDLDLLLCLVVLVAFGQRDMEMLDTEANLFNQIARDLGVSMREWWTPDDAFLAGIRRAELEQVAIESGASLRMGRLASTRKADLVRALAKHFERTANPDAELDEHDRKGREWLPGAMRFPAKVSAINTEA